MSEKAKPVAWLHEIKEPEGHQMAMYSQFETNPWSHWVSAHLGQCEYKCSPLYPASAIAALEAERDALRKDSQRYEYLLDCDVQAAVHYLPRIDVERYKATKRRNHDAAIAAITAKGAQS